MAPRDITVVVRQSGGKVIELLHQQDRHVSAARQLADHLANLLMTEGWIPRWVHQDQQLWAAGQRAADRQLLLLAAG